MYADPTNIRKNRVTIYFNDLEDELVNAVNNYKGTQKSTLLREMLLAQARKTLADEFNGGGMGQQMEAPQMSLFGS